MSVETSDELRRMSRGPKGPGPPPLEIEKQKKKEEKVIRANFKLFHLYFATLLVENIIFSAEKLKSKKKKKEKLSDFAHPPLRIPGHAPGT